MYLSENLTLRQAQARDLWSIRKLVFSAKLDPTQLRWQQFWLIESESKIIACGQLRNFSDVQELGSLVVVSSWRKKGLGTYLAKHLIEQASKPLYLECLGYNLAEFYTHLGFFPVFWQEIPQSLRFKFAISQLAKTILRIPVKFMKLAMENRNSENKDYKITDDRKLLE
jgi:amino-acid N-acetyltransferase